MRALAVILVLIFHLWPNRLSGGYIGVDVFFVISGYLITSHLFGHPPRDLRGVASFWARRIRRLLPASLLVITATLVASRLIAPETQWANTAEDARGATLYILNWRLATESVDYMAADDAPSPLQHFWSLSVEEQFYGFWPLLILALAFVAARRGRDALMSILLGLSVVVAASFAASLWMAHQQPAVGYFVTYTRIWELGVGALLAGYILRRERTGRGELVVAGRWRTMGTLLGLAAIAGAALTYTSSTPFPGWHAAVPVLGSALLIAIGTAAQPTLLDRVLDNPMAVRVGDISYSIYLWHWPLIVLLPVVSGGHLGRLDKAAVIVTTFVLSALTKTWVEDRFRRPRRSQQRQKARLRPVFVLAGAGMAVLVALTVVQVAEVSHRQELARASLKTALEGDQKCFGANATVPASGCPKTLSGEVVPAPAQAPRDRSSAFPKCQEQRPYDGTVTCTFGDPRGTVDVALAGNSHTLHWVPALDEIGRESGWKITTYMSAGCPLADIRSDQPTEDLVSGCFGWGQRVLKKLRDGQFDLVVMSTLAPEETYDSAERERFLGGHRSYISRLTAKAGPPVVVIRDVPEPRETIDIEIPDCVAQNRDDLRACSGPRSTWTERDDLLAEAARGLRDDRVTVTDLTDRFCDDRRCWSVIGGVLVYAERSHLTATYSRTLGRFLAVPLTEALSASRR